MLLGFISLLIYGFLLWFRPPLLTPVSIFTPTSLYLQLPHGKGRGGKGKRGGRGNVLDSRQNGRKESDEQYSLGERTVRTSRTIKDGHTQDNTAWGAYSANSALSSMGRLRSTNVGRTEPSQWVCPSDPGILRHKGFPYSTLSNSGSQIVKRTAQRRNGLPCDPRLKKPYHRS